MILLSLISVTVLLVSFTFLPLWRYEAWWVRSLDFPRLQLSLVAVGLMACDLTLLDFSGSVAWFLFIVAAACLAFHLWWILPFTPIYPSEVKSASTPGYQRIRIMTANVLTQNRNSAALIGLVNSNTPDVLVTLESDEWWQSQLDVLERDLPYAIKCPLDNLYGMHVYSRYPLSNSRIEFLVESDIPSMHTLVHLPSGDQIRIHFLHPAPPSPTENDASSERDAELLVVAKSVRKSTLPVIVTGDLNDVSWSATTRLFRKISGLLDPRVGRGMYNTFHAKYRFVRWPLDHLFHSSHFKLATMRRLPPFGSDHFALFTELSFDPVNGENTNGLTADKEDQLWADRKIEEQDVSQKDVPQP